MAEAKKKPQEQEEDPNKIAKTLGSLLSMAKEHRKESTTEWEEDFKVYKGEDQPTSVRSKRRSNTKTNFIFSEIETIKPILTSQVPSISLKPVMDSDIWREIAENMTKNVNRVFDRNDFRARMLEVVSNGLHFATGYFKLTWDKFAFAGNGDIRIEVPDTRSIFREPGKIVLRDANWIFEVTTVDQLSLSRKHPKKLEGIRKLFQKGAMPKGIPTGKTKQAFAADTIAAPEAAATTTTSRFFDVMDNVNIEDPMMVELAEAWFHDDTMVEGLVEIIDPKENTKKRKKMNVKKFPNGRLVQFAEGMVFVDQPNKFPGIPYIEYNNYFVPGELYGMSELRQTVPIQRQYNIRNNQLYDLMNFNLGPIRFFDQRSGLDPNTITNAPNQWVPVNDVNGVKTEAAPHISQAAFESLLKIKKELETVFGVQEVTQGTIPGDIRSGVAIEALQESADIRLRGKSGDLQSAIRELTKLVILFMVEFYEHGVHFRMSDEVLSSEEWKFFKDKTLTGDFFDIEIRAGVNLPRSRVAKQQLLLDLHGRGVIDDQFLIENLQLEGKDVLESRMKDIWDAKREATLAQAQAASQPEPPSGGTQ